MSDVVDEHLEEALAAARHSEVKRHIREAMQYREGL
jgi:hypothetical protein